MLSISEKCLRKKKLNGIQWGKSWFVSKKGLKNFSNQQQAWAKTALGAN
jgi:hypothetical protein